MLDLIILALLSNGDLEFLCEFPQLILYLAMGENPPRNFSCASFIYFLADLQNWVECFILCRYVLRKCSWPRKLFPLFCKKERKEEHALSFQPSSLVTGKRIHGDLCLFRWHFDTWISCRSMDWLLLMPPRREIAPERVGGRGSQSCNSFIVKRTMIFKNRGLMWRSDWNMLK